MIPRSGDQREHDVLSIAAVLLAFSGSTSAKTGLARSVVHTMVQEMQAVGGSIQMGFDSQFQGSDREINHHGGILLSVHCDSSEWTKRAKEILEYTGAEDISSTSEASSDDATIDRHLPRAV